MKPLEWKGPMRVRVNQDLSAEAVIIQMMSVARTYNAVVTAYLKGYKLTVTVHSDPAAVLAEYNQRRAKVAARKAYERQRRAAAARPAKQMSKCHARVTDAQIDRAAAKCFPKIASLYPPTDAEKALFTGAVKNGRGLTAEQLADLKKRLLCADQNWLYLRTVNDAICRANTAANALEKYFAPKRSADAPPIPTLP